VVTWSALARVARPHRGCEPKWCTPAPGCEGSLARCAGCHLVRKRGQGRSACAHTGEASVSLMARFSCEKRVTWDACFVSGSLVQLKAPGVARPAQRAALLCAEWLLSLERRRRRRGPAGGLGQQRAAVWWGGGAGSHPARRGGAARQPHGAAAAGVPRAKRAAPWNDMEGSRQARTQRLV